MNILVLTTYYYPHWTGLTQYAVRFSEGMAKKGHTVKVLTTKHEQLLISSDCHRRVFIERSYVLFRFSRTLISLELIIKLIQTIPLADCIVVYLPYAEVLIAAIISKIYRKRLLLIHNGDLVLPRNLVSGCIESTYKIITHAACILADKIIVQTMDYAETSTVLSKHLGKCNVILPLYPDTPKSKIDGIKKVLMGKPVIGFAGRFVEE